MTRSKLPLGYVEFHTDDKIHPDTAVARMTGPATVVQHHPEGWQQVQRWGRKSMTQYQGAPGWELQIPIIFDGFRRGISVEDNCRALEVLSGFVDAWGRTPLITVDADGDIPHDLTRSPGLLWVIQGVTWGDYITNQDHDRVRQVATVNVWEWVPDDVAVLKERPQARGVKRPKRIRIKKGDTLQKIAAHYYGDQSKWRGLARSNHIRDPNHLKVGSWIRLPNLTPVKKKKPASSDANS